MDVIQKMIQDMEEKYHMLLEKKGSGILYVFWKLWKDYDISACTDEKSRLECLVFNIIIASMIVKEKTDITEGYGIRIHQILWEYRENKENLCVCYSDNDMGILEGMIDQIAPYDEMYSVKEMIQEVEEDYHMFLKENRGIEYVFIRLWEDYDMYGHAFEGDKLQMLVFNIIITSMNIKEEASIVASFGMEIRGRMRKYEENKEKLPIYYDENDIKLIEDMINQINACKEKWVK